MVLILPFQKFEVMILKEINTFIRLGCIKLIKSDSKDISVMTTLGGIGMVMYMTMLMCLVLAE